MSDDKTPEDGSSIPNAEELGRLLERGEWIDIGEVNRMLGFTEKDLRDALDFPAPEM